MMFITLSNNTEKKYVCKYLDSINCQDVGKSRSRIYSCSCFSSFQQIESASSAFILYFFVMEDGARKLSFWQEERAFLYLTGYISEE